MVLREDQVRTLMSEIGCNNKAYKKGVTLIEILVVLIIIGVATTLITLNFSSIDYVKKQTNSFHNTIRYLTEESIVTGSIIGLYLSSDSQYAEYLSNQEKNELNTNLKSAFWTDISSLRKTFKFEDGSVIELVEERFNYPTLIFYPSGENSGGRLEIYHPNYIQRIIVNTNGLIKDEIISY